jgi:transposase InsO family protein
MDVSRSGFYDWRDRPASATAERREELKLLIVKSFKDSDATYGYRRVHADLAGWGVPCGPELARSLMRELGLEPCQPRPWRASLTEQDGQEHHIPDLVQRDFTAAAPGLKMVGDITYIPTWEGWVYLATVIDCHTRAVVGWAMDDNYKTPLIEQAIAMTARNHSLADDAVFHSDRGSNYTSSHTDLPQPHCLSEDRLKPPWARWRARPVRSAGSHTAGEPPAACRQIPSTDRDIQDRRLPEATAAATAMVTTTVDHVAAW